MDHRTGTRHGSWLEMVVLIGLAVAALVVLGVVPLRTVVSLGVFLICPLMMLGMHGRCGHGGMHGGAHGEAHGGSDRHNAADERFDGDP